MKSIDQLHRYLFTHANVRGELVQLQDTYQAMLTGHDYPPVIQQLLGELLAATCLLTATLKFEGEIAVQMQGDGAINYIVINGSHDQKMRGIARWQGDLTEQSFNELFIKGVLVITITPKQGERYQGMVALDKGDLASCLEAYFVQSEQLMTKIVLHADHHLGKAAGMLLQILPGDAAVTTDNNDFDHLSQLTDTISAEELFSLEAEPLLYRLYHQEEVELFEPQPVVFHCGCSKARSAAALASVSKDELLDIIAEQGNITMHCQYCNQQFVFDQIDVEAIHAGQFDAEQQTRQ